MKKRQKARKQASSRKSARRREGGRGPSDKSKESKVRKLMRLAKSGGNRSANRSNARAQNVRAQTRLSRR